MSRDLVGKDISSNRSCGALYC